MKVMIFDLFKQFSGSLTVLLISPLTGNLLIMFFTKSVSVDPETDAFSMSKSQGIIPLSL